MSKKGLKIYEGFKEGHQYILSTEKGYLFFPDKKEAKKFRDKWKYDKF